VGNKGTPKLKTAETTPVHRFTDRRRLLAAFNPAQVEATSAGTISLRDENGDVLQARQVSTEPEKISAFFQRLTRECLQRRVSFVAVLEVCGFNDWRFLFSAFSATTCDNPTAETALSVSKMTVQDNYPVPERIIVR
jgi:hypothetical protein